jgi:redox-sensitive bicupin YhaK (pirin superfamily)
VIRQQPDPPVAQFPVAQSPGSPITRQPDLNESNNKVNAIDPVLKKRTSQKRGRANIGWLDSRHSFSFGSYLAPLNMGFRCLRVINEDRVVVGKAYGNHAHENMQILTYVISGSLEQNDSMGSRVVLETGDFQLITAGAGMTHNESNCSRFEPLHLYQFWFYPNQQNLKSNHEKRNFGFDSDRHPLQRIGSIDGRDGTLRLEQDIHLYLGRFNIDQTCEFSIAAGRHAWIQAIDGDLRITPMSDTSTPGNRGVTLCAGDGLAISDLTQVELQSQSPSEIMLFDLA